MAGGTLKQLASADARALGAIRAGICGFFLVSILTTSFDALGELPATLLRPTGVMQVFSWRLFDALLTPGGMMLLKGLMVAALAAAAAGLLTGFSTKTAAALILFYEGLLRSFGHFNHDEMPAVYILLVLAFTPCADAFSVDSYIRRRGGRAEGFVYGYPILLMRALVAWSYFSSALIKLRIAGGAYFAPDNLPALSILHSLDNLHDTQYRLAFLLPQYRAYLPLLVALVLLWELSFPLAIFFRRARYLILSAGVVFHLSTIFTMNLLFPFHLATYLVFFDWPKLLDFVQGRGRRTTASGEAPGGAHEGDETPTGV